MKRFLSLTATMLALVFASSCVQEEFGQNESDEAVGTLSVTLPDVVTKVYGDGMYGAPQIGERTRLHCHRVTFLHPVTGEELSVISAVPEDFYGNI